MLFSTSASNLPLLAFDSNSACSLTVPLKTQSISISRFSRSLILCYASSILFYSAAILFALDSFAYIDLNSLLKQCACFRLFSCYLINSAVQKFIASSLFLASYASAFAFSLRSLSFFLSFSNATISSYALLSFCDWRASRYSLAFSRRFDSSS